jgi:hypothetical protein
MWDACLQIFSKPHPLAKINLASFSNHLTIRYKINFDIPEHLRNNNFVYVNLNQIFIKNFEKINPLTVLLPFLYDYELFECV